MPAQPEIRILKTAAELFETAAAEFTAQAAEAVRANGRFTVALSGGSTPKRLYSLLATKPGIPWDKVYFFWGDERHVPPDDPESNYRMVNEAMLSKIPVPAENVFRMHAEEKDAAQPPSNTKKMINRFFHLSPGEFPRFDLIFLGLDLTDTPLPSFPTLPRSMNPSPGSRKLGAKSSIPTASLLLSRSQCGCLRDVSREWSR